MSVIIRLGLSVGYGGLNHHAEADLGGGGLRGLQPPPPSPQHTLSCQLASRLQAVSVQSVSIFHCARVTVCNLGNGKVFILTFNIIEIDRAHVRSR